MEGDTQLDLALDRLDQDGQPVDPAGPAAAFTSAF